MKIIATADAHGILPKIPECDVLICAGDMFPDRNQEAFILGPFRKWLERAPADDVVWIGGNHDRVLAEPPESLREALAGLPGYYLQDSAVTIDGVKIYGTPWTVQFGHWWFMADEDRLETLFAEIPEDTDILVSHGPPAFHCDRNLESMGCGSLALYRRLHTVQCDLVICGHIHEAAGYKPFLRGDRPSAQVFNVSYVDAMCQPRNPPVELFY